MFMHKISSAATYGGVTARAGLIPHEGWVCRLLTSCVLRFGGVLRVSKHVINSTGAATSGVSKSRAITVEPGSMWYEVAGVADFTKATF